MIHTAKPGVVIGKKGSDISDIKSFVEKMTGADVAVNVVEIKRAETNAVLIAANIAKQIENRVRWRESVINMIENNVDHFIEIGPGKVLSGLVKRISRDVKIDTINSQSDIENLKI